jgi:hypothetical protein
MSKVHRNKREAIFGLEEHDLQGDLDKVIKRLQEFRERYSLYHQIELTIRSWEDGWGGTEMEVEAVGFRKESDEERLKRIVTSRKRSEYARKLKEKQKLEKETKERELLEKLKKKYET